MVAITLPDGSVRRYDGPVTGAGLAADIGPGLAKAALAVKVDGDLRDLVREIAGDTSVEIVTRDHQDALELLRHDAAHVLAEAVQELHPGTKITFGPAIEDGFYYDFHREEPFTPADFEAIEQRMAEIVSRDETIEREVWSRDDAVTHFLEVGETFKAEHVGSLPDGEELTIYRQGDWLDLCRGPHLPSTGHLGTAFKLLKLAGSYWRGDPDNPRLQRIYGTCWRDAKELKTYLHRLEEAEKRDHRRLGREMGLFHIQDEATGSVFWHPKGWVVYRELAAYMRQRLEMAGYVEVKTPQMLSRSLWEASGHWEKFRELMFTTQDNASRTDSAQLDDAQPDDAQPGGTQGDGSDGGRRMLALKPMNCPGHVQIFKQGIKSYRDLPLRMAEFGACHRNEPSGALHGLMRVRAFTQDDGHIFCTEEQIEAETAAFIDLLSSIYSNLGFEEFVIKFADRPPERAGEDSTWDQAEKALLEATQATGAALEMNPGEGAFYGPKLEFVLRDAIGRDWQCGTLQVDFVLPERLDATYIAPDGSVRRPVMLHRAILGSFERFLGVLIEHYAGRLPLWLTPVQVVATTITSDADSWAEEVAAACGDAGLRSATDLRNEKINYKVREHSLAKVPVMLVVGKREAEARTVAIRRLGGKAQEILALDDAIHTLVSEAAVPGT